MDTKRLVEDNLRLVYYFYNKLGKTELVERHKDDIISEGIIGLIKAANSYIDGKSKFATYASRCIYNQMLMYLRRVRKEEREVSLFTPLNIDADGNELLLMDTLADDGGGLDILIEEVEVQSKYRTFFDGLSEREQQVLRLKEKEYNQRQIAEEIGISQSYVSRLLKKLKAKFKKEK